MRALQTQSTATCDRGYVNRCRVATRNVERHGFTLVELTVVLLLISILAVTAAPKWTASLQRLRVSNAANRIIADLASAQAAAYGASVSKTITFAVKNNQYTVSGISSLKLGAVPYIVDLSQDPIQCTFVSVFGQTSDQTLTFNGYGVPNRGGNIIVSCGDLQKTIVVDATSGLAVAQ